MTLQTSFLVFALLSIIMIVVVSAFIVKLDILAKQLKKMQVAHNELNTKLSETIKDVNGNFSQVSSILNQITKEIENIHWNDKRNIAE